MEIGMIDNDRSLEDELLKDFKSGVGKCKKCDGTGERIIEYLNEKGDDMEQRKEICECMIENRELKERNTQVNKTMRNIINNF